MSWPGEVSLGCRGPGGQEETAKGSCPRLGWAIAGIVWIDKDQGHIVVTKEESGGDRVLGAWCVCVGGGGLQDERGGKRRQEGNCRHLLRNNKQPLESPNPVPGIVSRNAWSPCS